MKSKKLISIILALTMLYAMFGNLTAFAINTPTEYKFIVNATNKDNESISGGTYTISYGDTVSNELNFGEENTVSILNQNTATLDLKALPTGYFFEGGSSVNFTLGDSNLTAFISAGMTATFDSETNLYTLSLMLQEQPILPSGSMKVTFKMKAQNAEKEDVSGVKYKVGDDEETTADGTSETTVTFGGYAVDSTLSITSVPEGYKKPETVTFNTSTLKTNFETAGYEATVTLTELDSYSIELTLTLEDDTDDDTTYTISIDKNYVDDNGKIEVQETAKAGEKVKINLKLEDGYDCSYVAIFSADNYAYYDSVEDYTTNDDGTRVYEMTMPEHNVSLIPYLYAIEYTYLIYSNQSIDPSEFKYKVIVDTTEGEEKCFEKNDRNSNEAKIILPYSSKDKIVKFVITEVPSGYEIPQVFTFTCGENPDYDSAPANYTRIYDNDYKTWGISLMLDTAKENDDDDDNTETKSPFTVKADVSKTTDKDSKTDGTQVEVGDTVTVDVTVNGDNNEDFTSADWEMLYDSSKFKLLDSKLHNDAEAVTSSSNVLAGKIIAPAGNSDGDEYESGTIVATYTFEVLSQTKDNVEGIFKILTAHANNYSIAGKDDNKVANKEDGKVVIVLVKDSKDDETGETQTPAGTFDASQKAYNGYYQTGNEFTLDEKFEKATVTYAQAEEGKEPSELTYRTTLPSWKDVGTYTYYAKISGAGLKTTYVNTTLTITPISLKPSAKFKVDPNVKNVTFVPTLEGVVDGSHAGTVTVKYTGEDGTLVTKELNATDFRYDGESTSVYNGSEVFSTKAYESGEFVVDLEYKKADVDNYTDGTGKATINVDKITADDKTVAAIEDAITNTFLYDSEKHSVVIDADALAGITAGKWSVSTIENAYDSTEDPEVTNVGEDKLVKIVFTDSTNNYNDVTIYAILKVDPRKVTITVDDAKKVKGATDPEFTGTIKVYDEKDNIVTEGLNENGVYGEDNLNVTYTREDGEEVGTYTIMASYEPNDNYTVTVEEGEFEITPPSTDKDDENAEVKIEVVDFYGIGDGTPDYVAGKRLILVYTNLDKVYYGYGDEDNYEKFFDVTDAGYKYVKNIYTNGVHTTESDETVYNHVYGIVVDAIDKYEATDEYEKKYRDKVVFLGSNSEYAPEDIVYDADINLSETLDVNDYSMTNGIYNTLSVYPRATYIRSFLKADYNHDKVVNTTDANEVKSAYENK